MIEFSDVPVVYQTKDPSAFAKLVQMFTGGTALPVLRFVDLIKQTASVKEAVDENAAEKSKGDDTQQATIAGGDVEMKDTS